MKSPHEIEALSNQALNSLNGMQPADANAFLYSKIKNRMHANRQEETARYTRLMFRLSAALVLFVGINVGSIFMLRQARPAKAPKTAAVSAISAFSDEFLPRDNSYSY